MCLNVRSTFLSRVFCKEKMPGFDWHANESINVDQKKVIYTFNFPSTPTSNSLPVIAPATNFKRLITFPSLVSQ